MNSCLTCIFYGNSSLQIWGPGRKYVWELVQSKSCISRILTSELKKQSLDKLLINKRNSGRFTIVNLAFILRPLPMQQTRQAFTIVKWEKLVTLKKTETMVNFTYYSKKKPMQVWPQPMRMNDLLSQSPCWNDGGLPGISLWVGFFRLKFPSFNSRFHIGKYFSE